MADEEVGRVAVRVGANTQPLDQGLDQAGRRVRQFGNSAGSDLADFAGRATKALGGVTVVAGALVAGIAAFAAPMAAAANQIEILSKAAGTSAREFQRGAAAVNEYGIEQDKWGKILGDVTAKVGEFLANGGGPMADFFKNIAWRVGVTADAFKGLSGPDALQLYVDTLEKANVSQAETSFYLNKLNGDLGNLAPLFANGGEQMKALGDEAERTGRVFSDIDQANLLELHSALDGLGDSAESLKNTVVTGLAPAITGLVQGAADGTSYMVSLADAIKTIGSNSGIAMPTMSAFTKSILLDMIPGAKEAAALLETVSDKIMDTSNAIKAETAAEEARTKARVDAKTKLDDLLTAERERRQLMNDIADGKSVSGITDPNAEFGVGGDAFQSNFEDFQKKWSEDPNLEQFGLNSDGFESGAGTEGEGGFVPLDVNTMFPFIDEMENEDPFETSLDKFKAYMDEVHDYAYHTSGGISQTLYENFGKGAGAVAAAGQAMVEGFGENSRKMFEIAKAWAYADAIVSTSQGVMKALATKDYGGAVFIAAKGAMEIARISKMKFAGKGGSTSGGGGSASVGRPASEGSSSAGAAPQGPQTTMYIEGFNRDSLYTGSTLENMANALVKLQKDGGFNLVYGGNK